MLRQTSSTKMTVVWVEIPQDHENKIQKTLCKFYDQQDTIKVQKSLIFQVPNNYLMSGKVIIYPHMHH